MRHIKGVKQSLIGNKNRQQKQHDPHLQNTEDHGLENMFFFVMAHFMGQHGKQFAGSVPLYQGVEQDDAPMFSKSGKKSVGFAGTAGTIHDIYIFYRKINGTGICENRGFKLAVFQRGKFIEQRHDPGRRYELNAKHV